MTWLKYDNAPIFIDTLYNRDQSERVSAHTKPRGFWITDDSEHCWRNWCTGEQWGLEGLTHKHEVELDETRILILNSEYEVRAFAREYNIDQWWGGSNDKKYCDHCIDWQRVAKTYAGIIITPYIWSLRLEDGFSWYYGWDCASGCIWDVSAIKDVRLIEIDLGIVDRHKREEAAA